MTDNEKRAHDFAIAVLIKEGIPSLGQNSPIMAKDKDEEYFKVYETAYDKALKHFEKD